MKRSLFVCLLLAAFPFSAFSQMDINTVPHIETTVEVSREVIPDMITVRVELSELESRGKITLAQMEKAFADVLEAQGLDKEKVSVENQSVSPMRRTGCYSYKTYLVVLSDASEVATFFSLLDEFGIRTAAISSTEYSAKDSLLEQLRREAVLQTRKEAISMAEAVSQKIGKAIYIHSNAKVRNDEFFMRGLTKYSNDVATDSPLADIAIKTLKFTQTITAYYELQ